MIVQNSVAPEIWHYNEDCGVDVDVRPLIAQQLLLTDVDGHKNY